MRRNVNSHYWNRAARTSQHRHRVAAGKLVIAIAIGSKRVNGHNYITRGIRGLSCRFLFFRNELRTEKNALAIK